MMELVRLIASAGAGGMLRISVFRLKQYVPQLRAFKQSVGGGGCQKGFE
ncbi:hypothetical protein [Paenibacillus sp. GCM10027626]